MRYALGGSDDPYAYEPVRFIGEYDDLEAWAEDVTDGLLPLLGATVAAWGRSKRVRSPGTTARTCATSATPCRSTAKHSR
ncbi:hypothetical protein GS982_19825 [Rhodococcus hoagii]|nr:hypothetical protein [Prescottella equi]